MNEITNAAPQVVNLLEQGGVTPEQIEHVAQDLVGRIWMVYTSGFGGYSSQRYDNKFRTSTASVYGK